MKKGFYMIASNNGIMEPEEGSFEHYYPLMVNRRADKGGSHSWNVTHVQTGRSISQNLPLAAARKLARNIKGCKVWEVSITTDDIHAYLASEIQEKEFLMKEREKAQRGYR